MVSAWATVLSSIIIVIVHHVGLNSVADTHTGTLGLACTAFAAPLAGAGLLALAGVSTKQPALWITAGLALAIASFVSPLALPLLVPAVIMICTESDSISFRFPAALAATLAVLFTFIVFAEGSAPIIGGEAFTPLSDNVASVVLLISALVAIAGFAWGVRADADSAFNQNLRPVDH